jgi:hypothetical protein
VKKNGVLEPLCKADGGHAAFSYKKDGVLESLCESKYKLAVKKNGVLESLCHCVDVPPAILVVFRRTYFPGMDTEITFDIFCQDVEGQNVYTLYELRNDCAK